MLYVAFSDPDLVNTGFTLPFELDSDARVTFFVYLFIRNDTDIRMVIILLQSCIIYDS